MSDVFVHEFVNVVLCMDCGSIVISCREFCTLNSKFRVKLAVKPRGPFTLDGLVLRKYLVFHFYALGLVFEVFIMIDGSKEKKCSSLCDIGL